MLYVSKQLKFAETALRDKLEVIWLHQPGHYTGFAVKPRDAQHLQELKSDPDYLLSPDYLVTPEGYVRPQFIDQPNKVELKKLQDWLTVNGTYASGDSLTVPPEGVNHFRITNGF
ncbi:hypothetical protein [Yersinia ruckeri]|uniref:hypothetical protein n=1 Tax=Yersinia ruckeri TaxID=29486 RepID=UPI00223873DC|nr:hypothetical protein [Yersinia ruckeri]MCW6598813.1 hypothetical protein [Yersinia ruckeri]